MDVVAGPQGSGKSTFFPVADRGIDSFNIDETRRRLSGGTSGTITPAVQAQALAEYERFIEDHIAQRRSFAFECTLAREITFEQAARAQAAGFQVHVTYVATDAETARERVIRRAHAGGHGARLGAMRQVYGASMQNLERALRLFAGVQVYDSSAEAHLDERLYEAKPVLVLETQDGEVTYVAASPPDWLRRALAGTAFALD